MARAAHVGVVVVGLAIQLLASGCSGESGLLSLFGGGSSSDSSDSGVLGSGATSPGGALSAASGDGSGGGGLSGGAPQVATDTHLPEPGSMVLFGGGIGGLAGLTLWRRRRSRRRSSTT